MVPFYNHIFAQVKNRKYGLCPKKPIFHMTLSFFQDNLMHVDYLEKQKENHIKIFGYRVSPNPKPENFKSF